MNNINLPDANSLYEQLKNGVKKSINDKTHIVGIISGGVLLTNQLQKDLKIKNQIGMISSSLHRDDFAKRGLAGLSMGAKTNLPFEIEGADILLIDDVLHTGRTIRAVINELFDFGRPARVRLAVLVDRQGGRQLPISADISAHEMKLDGSKTLLLSSSEKGFQLLVE